MVWCVPWWSQQAWGDEADLQGTTGGLCCAYLRKPFLSGVVQLTQQMHLVFLCVERSFIVGCFLVFLQRPKRGFSWEGSRHPVAILLFFSAHCVTLRSAQLTWFLCACSVNNPVRQPGFYLIGAGAPALGRSLCSSDSLAGFWFALGGATLERCGATSQPAPEDMYPGQHLKPECGQNISAQPQCCYQCWRNCVPRPGP